MANDRSLSPRDIDTLVKWADGGAPKGDEKDLPAEPVFPEGGWAFGTPDAVIDLPIESQVPATGEIPLKKIPGWAVGVSCAVCLFFIGIRHGWLAG